MPNVYPNGLTDSRQTNSLAGVCRIAWKFAAVAAIFLFIPNPTTAQDETATEGTALMPAVHITNTQIQQDGDKLTGAFTIKNSETDTFGGIYYQLQLIGPRETIPLNQLSFDDVPLYENTIVNEPITLVGGTEKNIPVSYNLPALPDGNYRVRVQLVTNRGVELGWKDIPLTLSGHPERQPLVTIAIQGVFAPDQSTVGNPGEGINVNPEENIFLGYSITNNGDKVRTLTPSVSVWEFAKVRKKIDTMPGSPVTVAPNNTADFTMPIIANEVPESYYAELTLLDNEGNRVSNIAPYRWVVMGNSAEVVTTRIEELALSKGGYMKIRAEVTGPADRVTKVKGRVEVSIWENGNMIGSAISDLMDLGAGINKYDADIRLNANASYPNIRVRVLGDDGKVLEEDNITLLLSNAQRLGLLNARNLGWSTVAGIIAALLLIAAIVFAMIRKKPRLRKAPATTVVLALAVSLGLGLLAHSALAIQGHFCKETNWTNTSNGFWRYKACCTGDCDPNIRETQRLFINSPIHQNNYTDLANASDPNSPYMVNAEGFVRVMACNNSTPTTAKVETQWTNVNEPQQWASYRQPCYGAGHKICYIDQPKFHGQLTFDKSLSTARFDTHFYETFSGSWGRSDADFYAYQEFNLSRPQPIPPVTCSPANSEITTAQGDSILLLASGGSEDGYGWQSNGGALSTSAGTTSSFSASSPGTYEVRVVDSAHPTNEGVCQVTVISAPTPTPTPTPVITPTPTPILPPTPTPTLYQCSDGKDNDGDGYIDCDDPGCYRNDIFGNGACRPWDNNENQKPLAAITAPNGRLCMDAPVTLSSSLSSDPDGTIWARKWVIIALTQEQQLDHETSNGGETISFDPVGVGDYQIFLRVFDNHNAASLYATTQLSIEDCATPPSNTAPIAVIDDVDEVCTGSLVTLDGSGSYDSDGSVAGYSWTVSPAASLYLSDNGKLATFTAPNEPKDFTASLIVTDDKGATSTKKSITFKTKDCSNGSVSFSLISDFECPNQSVTAKDTTQTTGVVDRQWSIVPPLDIQPDSKAQDITFTPAAYGTYSIALGIAGYEPLAKSFTLTNQPPQVSLGDPISTTVMSNVSVVADVTDNCSDPIDHYEWTLTKPDNSSETSTSNPPQNTYNFQPQQVGSYTVKVVAVDIYGVSSAASTKAVTVSANPIDPGGIHTGD